MRVTVALDHRYSRAPDGTVWTTGAHDRRFWQRYLDVFEHVSVLARVADVAQCPASAVRADGEGVSLTPVPYYLGPWEYLRRAHRINRSIRRALSDAEALILRVPAQVSSCAERWLRREGRPYAVEVIGDPRDTFGPGAVAHPLRPLLRSWVPRQLRRQCAQACAAAYVTQEFLQRRYPPGPDVPPIGCSDVDLPSSAFVARPRTPAPFPGQVTMVTVGSLMHRYKGTDLLVDALAIGANAGMDLRLVVVGGGHLLPSLQARAEAAGVGPRVRFLGAVPAGEPVRRQLDAADLFVLPSLTEGLPRALVEAMARALPCIGSRVGGIPELLPPEDTVPPGDTAALAARIREVLSDPERQARMSARNLERAKEYGEEILRPRRAAFYRRVKELTAAWRHSLERE